MEFEDHRAAPAGAELILDSTVAAEGEGRTPPVPVSGELWIEDHLIVGVEAETLELDSHPLNDARSGGRPPGSCSRGSSATPPGQARPGPSSNGTYGRSARGTSWRQRPWSPSSCRRSR